MAAFTHLSWSALASIGGAALEIAKIILLTQFLAPGDFAIFAIVTVVVGFSQLFAEGGVGNALVSQSSLSATQTGQILNFNLLISAVVIAVVWGATPLIADFYQHAELNSLVPAVLITIPLAAASRICTAVLQHQMQMQRIAAATLFSKMIGLGVAYIACVMHQGIWALVWSAIATSFIYLVMLYWAARKGIHLQLKIQMEKIRPVLSFSLFQLGEFILNFFAKNFDVLLITKLLGPAPAGIYVVSKNLLVRGGDIIVSVFVRYFHPQMAKTQLDAVNLQTMFCSFYRSVTLTVVVAYTCVAINSDLLVESLLDEQYWAAKSLFVIMSLWLALRYSTAPVATLWLVKQKPQLGVLWNVLVALLVPCVVYFNADSELSYVVWGLIALQVALLILSVVTSSYLTQWSRTVSSLQVVWLLSIFSVCIAFYFCANASPSLWLNLGLSALLCLVFVVLVVKKRGWFLGDVN